MSCQYADNVPNWITSYDSYNKLNPQSYISKQNIFQILVKSIRPKLYIHLILLTLKHLSSNSINTNIWAVILLTLTFEHLILLTLKHLSSNSWSRLINIMHGKLIQWVQTFVDWTEPKRNPKQKPCRWHDTTNTYTIPPICLTRCLQTT